MTIMFPAVPLGLISCLLLVGIGVGVCIMSRP